MKINTKEVLKTFKGEPLKAGDEELTLGMALSNILLGDRAGGKMKLFILAEKFYKEKSVELDTADLAMVKTAVEKTELFNALVTGQILVGLEELKKDA
jgi:hypothetical protein